MMRPEPHGPSPCRKYAFGLMEGNRIGYVFMMHLHFGSVTIRFSSHIGTILTRGLDD